MQNYVVFFCFFLSLKKKEFVHLFFALLKLFDYHSNVCNSAVGGCQNTPQGCMYATGNVVVLVGASVNVPMTNCGTGQCEASFGFRQCLSVVIVNGCHSFFLPIKSCLFFYPFLYTTTRIIYFLMLFKFSKETKKSFLYHSFICAFLVHLPTWFRTSRHLCPYQLCNQPPNRCFDWAGILYCHWCNYW